MPVLFRPGAIAKGCEKKKKPAENITFILLWWD